MKENFVPLNCRNCGAKLDVFDDMDRFACGFCGTEMFVERRGGTVALKRVEAGIARVQAGTDRTAAELALVRLRQDLQRLIAAEAALNRPLEPPVLEVTGGAVSSISSLLIISFIVMPFVVDEWTIWGIHDPLLRAIV